MRLRGERVRDVRGVREVRGERVRGERGEGEGGVCCIRPITEAAIFHVFSSADAGLLQPFLTIQPLEWVVPGFYGCCTKNKRCTLICRI